MKALKKKNLGKYAECLWIEAINMVKMSVVPKVTHRISAIPINIPGSFHRNKVRCGSEVHRTMTCLII